MPNVNSAFKRIAHRGASGEAPENTLEAVRLAFEKYKVDMVEVDLRLSKDGVPIILHDETLDRTTDGKGPVSHYTVEEIKKKDAGFHFDPEKKGEFPYRGKGVTVPTFQELLKEYPNHGFFLEIKDENPRCVRKILSVIERSQGKGALTIGSFHGPVTREVRRLRPPYIRSVLSRDEVFWPYVKFRLGFTKFEPPCHRASLPRKDHGFQLDDRRWIEFLHHRGVKIYYWTIDDPGEMEALIDRDADGIMTNYPGRLNEVLEKQSSRRT
jgi:glycerophosphoryl diester phosphodiesterase